MTIKVCLAGATGWAGSALASGIHAADDMELVGGVSRTYAGKADVPSGTVRELAHRLGQVRESKLDIPLDEIQGPGECRGARLNDTQVHAILLPGYVISAEVIFGLPDQKLILRHEAGASAEPYVAGAMLAIRKVGSFSGLRRGLDTVMEIE